MLLSSWGSWEREGEREMGRLAVEGGVRDEEFVGGGGASCKELKSDMAAPWIDMENLDVASDRFFQKPGINAFGQAFRFTCIPPPSCKTWDHHHHSLVISSTWPCILRSLFGSKENTWNHCICPYTLGILVWTLITSTWSHIWKWKSSIWRRPPASN